MPRDARTPIDATTPDRSTPIGTGSGLAQAFWIGLGPFVLLIGILWHPFIVDLRDNAAVVAALEADETRWFLVHLTVALASALLLVSFLMVRTHVHPTGRERWTSRAIVPLVVGSILFAMLPAMEIGVLASHAAGQDALAVQNALDTWFMPILFAGSILFAVGTGLFAVGLARSRVLSPGIGRLVVAAMAVMAASRFAPFTASLMIGGVAAVLAFWPLAYSVWQQGSDAPLAGGAEPAPGR